MSRWHPGVFGSLILNFLVSKTVRNKFQFLGMVVHIYKPSTQESEAGGSWVQGQSVLHNEILSQKTNRLPLEPLCQP
jgi:hypothetical protein